MLEYLRIRDLALIEDMELEFGPGMNALTGETGAGKSFILKAINFLLGEKLGVEMVRPGREKAQVEALFARTEGDLVLRRELIAETGRSRFFINGDLGSQELVRELRPSLVLHAGQHGQQRLLQPAYQATLVDSFLPDTSLIAQKDTLLRELRAVAEERKTLHERIRTLEERRELLEMQQKEIEKVAPEPGEEERLETMRAELRGYEHLRQQYERGFTILRGEDGPGLADMLAALEKVLEDLSRFERQRIDAAINQDSAASAPDQGEEEAADSFTLSLNALLGFREELRELERLFRTPPHPAASSGMDPEELEERLYELAQLKRKLRRSLPEILELKAEVEENLSFLDACGLDVHRLAKRETELAAALRRLLEQTNAQRRQAAERFCHELEKELAGLGFSERVRVEPEFSSHILWPPADARSPSGVRQSHVSGASQKNLQNVSAPAPGNEGQHARPDICADTCVEERVRLLWAPNPGQASQPLDRIASGGELSRFLLAIVGIQARQACVEEATLIFDEVDAGVGGVTLNRVADRLADLASRRQMLLITHWPQLAVRAGRHFQVSKEEVGDNTFTRCQRLDGAAREAELARMAGQEEITSKNLR